MKSTQKGMIKGKITNNDYKHGIIIFKAYWVVIDNPTEIEEEGEPNIQILQPLEIKCGVTEQKLAKDIIKEGKSCGMDEFPPEVLKGCNLDSNIIQLCNRALINKEKPHSGQY